MKKRKNISRIFDFSVLRVLFIIAAIMFLIANVAMASAVYTVPTSRGDVKMVIPDGVTIEQAYVGVAQLYLEERYDYEELRDSADQLITDVTDYQGQVAQLTLDYQNLSQAQTGLTTVLDAKVKTDWIQPLVFLSIGSIGSVPIFNGSSITIGVLAFEKIIVGTSVIYPFSLGFTIGMVI